MPHEVLITARAEADVAAALAWLNERSLAAASRWHAALLATVQTLEDGPERCPLAAEAQDLGIELRELLFGKRPSVYRILFTIEGNTVNVLHIRHAGRDWLKPEAIDG
jgi:plasmid stabilization system protein ParE